MRCRYGDTWAEIDVERRALERREKNIKRGGQVENFPLCGNSCVSRQRARSLAEIARYLLRKESLGHPKRISPDSAAVEKFKRPENCNWDAIGERGRLSPRPSVNDVKFLIHLMRREIRVGINGAIYRTRSSLYRKHISDSTICYFVTFFNLLSRGKDVKLPVKSIFVSVNLVVPFFVVFLFSFAVDDRHSH